MDLQALQTRKANLAAQRAQFMEEANRQLAMLDGAILLIDEMLAEMSAGNAPDEEE